MALVITDKARAQSATGAGTMACTTGSVSVTAGALLVALVAINANYNSTGSSDATFVISDTFGDTGGTAWTSQAICTRGAVSGAGGGAYMEKVEIWTRVVGTGPLAGAATATVTANAGAVTTSSDQWTWADLVEVTGQHASPIGNTTGTTGRQAAGPTTYALTLGGAPASTSAIFSIIHGDNTTTVSTVPTSWSTLNEDHPAWGSISHSADINGSGSTISTWTGLATGSNYLGSALEIVAAGVAALATPAPIVSRQAVHRASRW